MNTIKNYSSNNDISITIEVDVNKDFSKITEGLFINSGFIQIESIYLTNKKYCFWDNLNFFLKASEKEIKKECKEELIQKNLYYKGIFKDIQKSLKQFIELGYLTKNCKKDY